MCRVVYLRFAALLGTAIAVLVPQSAWSAAFPASAAEPQPVVLMSGRSLLERSLPAFIQIQPGRFLEARVVQRACATPSLKADDLLLYAADLQQCETIKIQERILLRQHLLGLTGRWFANDVQAELAERSFLALEAVNDSSDQVRVSCICPSNTPPTGSVSCAAQVRTEGTPIGSIDFVANDIDGDALSGEFSYQHDADPVQAGLPTPLTSSCVPATGSLQCTIQGLAPSPAGILQLVLTVSDGTSSAPFSTLIEVLPSFADRIFANGFDSPGCL